MNNNYFNKLKTTLIKQMLLAIPISILIIILSNLIFRSTIISILRFINTDFYHFVTVYKSSFIALINIVLLVILEIIIINKNFKKLNIVFDSIPKILDDNDNKILLGSDFESVEIMLNNTKTLLQNTRKSALESEKSKNDLIVYMAHDLKTPLTSVIGYLSIMDEEKDLPNKLKNKYISISLTKAEKLELLINEFFEITRYNLYGAALNKKDLNIDILFKQLIEEFYPLLKDKDISYTLLVNPNAFIYADMEKIVRVFDNLLKNAINYSYKNSTIEIEVSETTNNSTKITFKNMGDIIPKNKLSNIFEKFYRADNSRNSKTGGAGLGLAISKEIIEAHAGTISVESTDKLTIFTIILPNKKEK